MTDTIIEKDTIHVIIGEDHSFNCTAVTIGRTGENSVTQLEIEIPSELNAFDAYLDFKKPKGQTKCTERLAIVNNIIEYDIQGDLLSENGNLEVQLVLRRADGDIWKSATKKFVVLKSIDAVENIPEKEDFITEVQKILDNVTSGSASAIKDSAIGVGSVRLDGVSPLEHGIKTKVLGVGEFICDCSNSSQAEFESNAGFYEISAIKLPVYVNYGDDESPDWQLEELGEFHFTDGSLYVDEMEDITEEQWNTFSVGEKLYFDGWEEANLYRSVSSGLSVTRYGKNLIPFPYGFGNTTQSGVTIAVNSDGGVTYNGTATSQINPYFASNLLLRKGTYTLSGSPKGSSWDTQILIVQKKDDASTIARDYGNGAKFTLDSDTAVRICLIVAKGVTCSNLTIYPMLNVGTTALPYELYKEPVTFTADENGNITVPSLAPTTTIVADSGVSMTAEYNVDTKAYIDKKFAELASAIVST